VWLNAEEAVQPSEGRCTGCHPLIPAFERDGQNNDKTLVKCFLPVVRFRRAAKGTDTVPKRMSPDIETSCLALISSDAVYLKGSSVSDKENQKSSN
jgi:hypothetical protein